MENKVLSIYSLEKERPECSNSGQMDVCYKSNETSLFIAESAIFYNSGDAMSQQRFIKFIPGPEADDLLIDHANAFKLLCIIASRARRTNERKDGLLIGDAILGNYESMGFTHKTYRNAISKLEELGYIEIVFNQKNKKQQKRSITKAIKSLVVNLKSSSIWDINSEDEGKQKGKEGANKGQTEGNKQERIRKNKKEKEEEVIEKDKSFSSAKLPKAARKKDKISFNHESKSFEGIEKEDLAQWQDAFPDVKIIPEIAKATLWLINHPERSHRIRWKKFLTNWMENAKRYQTQFTKTETHHHRYKTGEYDNAF